MIASVSKSLLLAPVFAGIAISACQSETPSAVITDSFGVDATSLETETAVVEAKVYPIVSGFEHRGPNEAYLTIKNVVGPATVTDAVSLERRSVDYDGAGYLIPFFNQTADGDGQLDTQTFNVAFTDIKGVAHAVAFVRQSPAELLDAGIDKADGYTILGPNTLDFSDFDKTQIQTLDSSFAADTRLPNVTTGRNVDAIQVAASAAAWINNQPLRYGGPTGAAPKSLDAQIRSLSNGETGLGSSNFRTLWMHLVHSAGGDVRAVNMTSYAPVYPDLTPYSFAMVEIRSGDDWIVVAPFNNAIFEHDGVLLSADSLRDILRKDRASVTVLPLLEGQTRTARSGQSGSISLPTPSSLTQYAGVVTLTEINWSNPAAP